HGDRERDHDAVYGAQGSTNVRAGYQAKAVLARWGDVEARAELQRALDYASPYREAALEAWFRVLHATDFERLDAARESDPELVWTVLRANATADEWLDSLTQHLRGDWQRETVWAS